LSSTKNKTMKKTFLLSLFLSFGLLVFAQNEIYNIKKAAENQVQSFLNLIPQGQERDYGFNSRQDFQKVTIGEPYQVYYVEKNTENTLKFTTVNEWRVPLLVNGVSVALVTVNVVNNQSNIVDFGASVLAKKLQAFEKAFTGKNERILIRNTYLRQDFIAPSFSALQVKGSLSINTKVTQVLYPLKSQELSTVKLDSFVAKTLAAPVQ